MPMKGYSDHYDRHLASRPLFVRPGLMSVTTAQPTCGAAAVSRVIAPLVQSQHWSPAMLVDRSGTSTGSLPAFHYAFNR